MAEITKDQALVDQNKPKDKNDVDKIVSFEAMVSYSLFFNINKGVLSWIRNNQAIYVETFKLTPDVGINSVKLLSEYEGDDIVTTLDTALSYAKEQLIHNLTTNLHSKNTESQVQVNVNENAEPNVQPNTQPNNIDPNNDKLTQEIEARYNANKTIAYPNERSTNIVKSNFNSPDDVKTDLMSHADDIKNNGLQYVIDSIYKTQFNQWDDKDRDIFKKGVNLTNEELYRSELNKINSDKNQQANNQDEPNVENTQIHSDDIYKERDPQLFKNIYKIQNDAEILLFVKNLKIKREFSYNATKTKSFNIILEPKDISLDIIGYVESKKTKIMINNNEIRPKSELGFIQHILPSIKIEILLDK